MNEKNFPVQENERIRKVLKEFEPEKENIISILHLIQDNQESNYIPGEALRAVADYLGITTSEAYGVISFYTMFSENSRGKYIIRVCTSAPCYVMGSDTVIGSLKKILGINIGETTKDNLFTLELSSCLGICDVAPAMMINDEVYGNLTHKKIEEIIEGMRHG